jgi:hypothetical protein
MGVVWAFGLGSPIGENSRIAPVEVIDCLLSNKIAGEFLRSAWPFTPEPYQGRFVAAHDDPSVRAADEVSSFKAVH